MQIPLEEMQYRKEYDRKVYWIQVNEKNFSKRLLVVKVHDIEVHIKETKKFLYGLAPI